MRSAAAADTASSAVSSAGLTASRHLLQKVPGKAPAPSPAPGPAAGSIAPGPELDIFIELPPGIERQVYKPLTQYFFLLKLLSF